VRSKAPAPAPAAFLERALERHRAQGPAGGGGSGSGGGGSGGGSTAAAAGHVAVDGATLRELHEVLEALAIEEAMADGGASDPDGGDGVWDEDDDGDGAYYDDDGGDGDDGEDALAGEADVRFLTGSMETLGFDSQWARRAALRVIYGPGAEVSLFALPAGEAPPASVRRLVRLGSGHGYKPRAEAVCDALDWAIVAAPRTCVPVRLGGAKAPNTPLVIVPPSGRAAASTASVHQHATVFHGKGQLRDAREAAAAVAAKPVVPLVIIRPGAKTDAAKAAEASAKRAEAEARASEAAAAPDALVIFFFFFFFFFFSNFLKSDDYFKLYVDAARP
jgi:hypothetical protein